MVFDKAGVMLDSTVDYELVTEEIIRKPLLVEFFGIDITNTSGQYPPGNRTNQRT